MSKAKVQVIYTGASGRKVEIGFSSTTEANKYRDMMKKIDPNSQPEVKEK